MTAPEKLLSRAIVASGFDTARWAGFPEALRDRAYFSAKVQNIRWLATSQDRMQRILEGGRTADGTRFERRDTLIDELMRVAREEGIATGSDGLTDPGSARRIGLVADMQAGFASGYADWEGGMEQGALDQFPAQELVRISPRIKTRDWQSIWISHGGTLTDDGRMVALKTDSIWTDISRFGVPWPPFDYESGMGLRDVGRQEAIRLGLIAPEWRAPVQAAQDFNRNLQAKVSFKGDADPLWLNLKASFGDQVVYDRSAGAIKWQGEALREKLARIMQSGRANELVWLGKPTPDALAAAYDDGVRLSGDGQLHFNTSELRHALQSHGVGIEARKGHVPVTAKDLELLPHLWRYPERLFVPDARRAGVVFQKGVADGWLNAVVSPRPAGGYDLETVYKWETPDVGQADGFPRP